MLLNTNLISHSFFKRSTFRFGERWGHLALCPVLDAPTKAELSIRSVLSFDPCSVLSNRLFEYLNHQSAKYEFRMQIDTDLAHHPTEDASMVRDEATAQYQMIGHLESPVHNSFDQKQGAF